MISVKDKIEDLTCRSGDSVDLFIADTLELDAELYHRIPAYRVRLRVYMDLRDKAIAERKTNEIR